MQITKRHKSKLMSSHINFDVFITVSQSTKNALLTVLLMSMGMASYAQQQTSVAQYMFNPLSINPAFAGFYDASVNFSARNQFQDFEGAPEHVMLSGQVSFPNNKMGVGGMILSDKIGVSKSTSVYGQYAFKLISQNRNSYTSWGHLPKTLSLGIQAGFTTYKEDLQQLQIDNDPNFEGNNSATIPNFGFGIYYSNRTYYMGLSSTQLFKGPESKNINLSQHFYLNGGVKINLGNSNALNLSTLVKYVAGAPVQINTNAIFNFRNIVNLGAGYRSQSAVNFMVGIIVSRVFRLGYFFDIPFNNSTLLGNEHELMINYRFITKP